MSRRVKRAGVLMGEISESSSPEAAGVNPLTVFIAGAAPFWPFLFFRLLGRALPVMSAGCGGPVDSEEGEAVGSRLQGVGRPPLSAILIGGVPYLGSCSTARSAADMGHASPSSRSPSGCSLATLKTFADV